MGNKNVKLHCHENIIFHISPDFKLLPKTLHSLFKCYNDVPAAAFK
jgi:hypothetical protein